MNYAPIRKALRWFDEQLLRVRQYQVRQGKPLCLSCTKGCSACCSEQVILTDAEVGLIMDGMSEDDREALKKKVWIWLAKAQLADVNPLVDISKPHQFLAIDYRRLQMPCPLLTDQGLCSVYDRRPLSCREFMTGGDPADCADLDKRERQKYVTIVELFDAARTNLLNATKEAGFEGIRVSHLGFLLAIELGLLEEDQVT